MKLCHFEAGLDKPFFLIAGTCVVESEQMTIDVAGRLKEITQKLGVPFIYKSSFDKANRSSGKSFRGPGMDEGLRILGEVKKQLGVPVLTDVHTEEEIEAVASVVDVLQTPAFLCRQTDFIHACARSGKPVNIKKGQFLAPHDMKNVIDKARDAAREAGLSEDRFMAQSAACRSVITISCPTCARSRSCAKPMRRSCSMQPIRCNCRAGRARARAASANSCRCSRARRSQPVWPVSSWRRIRPGVREVGRPERGAAASYGSAAQHAHHDRSRREKRRVSRERFQLSIGSNR